MRKIGVSWKSEMHFEAHLQDERVIQLDAAPQHGGHNAGCRPMDLLLTGLAGCTGMDVLSILQKKRQPINGLAVHVSGELAAEHPHVFTQIEVVYTIEGESVDPRAVERAIDLSSTKYCGAWAMLSKTATITPRYEINDSSVAVGR